MFEGGHGHRDELIVPQISGMGQSFRELSFKSEERIFVMEESREFVGSGEVGAQVESSEEKAIVDSTRRRGSSIC